MITLPFHPTMLLLAFAGALANIGYLFRCMGIVSVSQAPFVSPSFTLDLDGAKDVDVGEKEDRRRKNRSLRATPSSSNAIKEESWVFVDEEANAGDISSDEDDDANEQETGSFANCVGHTMAITNYHPDQKYVTVSCHTFPYRMPTMTADKEIIVGVLSAAGGSGPGRRTVIRETWASPHPHVQVYFIVAGPWEDIRSEYEEHGDLVWLHKEEVYEGEDSVLPYKTTAFMKIVHDGAVKEDFDKVDYVFKTDDDSFVDVGKLYPYLMDGEYDYWGSCQPVHVRPKRDDDNKWSVSRDIYPEEWFPPFCQGAGFALSWDFLECVSLRRGDHDLDSNHISKMRWMPFEDVAVGLLAERCGIEPTPASSLRIQLFRTAGNSDVTDEVTEERERVREGRSKIDRKKLPKPYMEGGKIVQHRIYDDEDMKEHWRLVHHTEDEMDLSEQNDANKESSTVAYAKNVVKMSNENDRKAMEKGRSVTNVKREKMIHKHNGQEVTSINLIGERHSGVDEVTDHLVDCFGDQIAVEAKFTRSKHWFQVDDPTIRKSAVVIAMFTDPYDWVEAMRELPHHAHNHIGFSSSEWKEFVTKPWTGTRGRADRSKMQHAKSDEISMDSWDCLGGYKFDEVLPCSEADSLVEDGYSNYMYELKHNEPHPEMPAGVKEWVSGDYDNKLAYDSIIDLRTAKILNFLEVSKYHGVKDFFAQQYEALKSDGTADLVQRLEEVTGLTASCTPLGGTGAIERKDVDLEFTEWMNKHHDWNAEAKVGYAKRDPAPRKDLQKWQTVKVLPAKQVTVTGPVNRRDPQSSPCLNKDFRSVNSKAVWTMMILDDDDSSYLEEGYREGFVSGAVKMGRSVLANVHEEPVDLVVMELSSKPLTSDTWKELHSVGWQRCTVERIAPLDEEETKTRFRDQFTKLRLWGMTMYDTLLYLDSDTLVVDSIDKLLQVDLRAKRKKIGVARDFRFEEWMPTFNMGVFLIHPSTQEYNRLLKLQRDPSIRYLELMAEQGWLNEVYWKHWHDIGFEHNANTCIFNEARPYWDSREKDIRIVHYTYKKPWRLELWECTPQRDIPCHWWNSFSAADSYQPGSSKSIAQAKTETLEFVHIPKAGGTSIELAAANAGVAWGWCKFYRGGGCSPLDDNDLAPPREHKSDWTCSIGDPSDITTEVSPWHCPPRHFQNANNLYHGSRTFAVVRNPYDRMVSDYYWAHTTFSHNRLPETQLNDPKTLNRWVQQQLEEAEQTGVCFMGHCIPMHEYTVDVDHVLHLENIDAELPILLKQYGLEKVQVGHMNANRDSNKLDASHLTNETRCRINRWSKLDFEYFGYDMIGGESCA